MTLDAEDDVQRAHDVLVAMVTGEIDIGLRAVDRDSLHFALDALCWVLRHDHNTAFGDNFGKLEAIAAARGYVMREIT